MDEGVQFANLTFLNSDDLNSVPPEVSVKVNERLEKLLEEKSSLSSKYERQKVDLEEALLQLQDVQEKVRILESTESKLSHNNAELRAAAVEFQQTKLHADTELSNAENNRQILTSVLERQEQQLSDLRDEQATLSAKCKQLTEELTQSQVKQVDGESSLNYLQTQLSRKETECLQLIEERNALDSEKLAYMRQISRLQMEKSSEVSNHHHSTETIKNDLSNTSQLLDTYKQQTESLTEKLRQEQARHRECRDNFIMAEESHRQELTSQKKLTAMYKEAEQKATGELEDLHKTAADYKECFEQLTLEHEETMAQTRLKVEELGDIITAKDEHIGQIESELARMNELVKESSESPDVTAELARLIKSGLTYSQLYHKYHQTADQHSVAKGENTRLNDCLDTLVKEIDVMRPQVLQLRTAHEASSSMVQKLSEQLQLNLQNLDAEARKAGEAKKSAIHYQKEVNKFTIENEDLACQVQVLTKEVHIAKGGRVVDDDLSTQVSSSSNRQAADVISSQLVSFKDIQELQKHNQQLRAALREVSEAQERADKAEQSSTRATALEKDLENTRQEVQHLKQSRLKQEELVESIIKQRDMYKRLVEQGDVRDAQAKASPRRPVTEVDNEKLKSLNDELKSSKASLEKTHLEFQAFRQEQSSNERSLVEQLEQVRKALTDQKLNNAKLTTQLDYSLESSRVIEKNVVAYKQEINALRTKAEQYSNLVAKNESLVSSLRQDLSRIQESSIKFDIANQHSRNEVELLKTSNRRLQIDADTARKDYNLQLQMLSNLQDIQTSIENSNTEMKMHYQHRLQQAHKDGEALQKQMEDLREQMKTTETHHSSEVSSCQSKIDSLNQELSTTQEKLLKSIEEQKLYRQTSVGRGGEVGATGENEGSSIAGSDESLDMKHARSELEALKDQLRLSGEASDEYRSAADRLEITLREHTAASQHIQESLEARVSQQQTDLDTLAMKIKDMAQQYDTIFEQKSNTETEAAHTKNLLSSELAELKSNLNSYKQRLESKEQVEAQARVDLQQASKLNDELSSKYQNELQNGLKLSEENSCVKKETDTQVSKVLALENDVIRMELQLQTNHASFEEREKSYKETVLNLQEQFDKSKEETKLLHQQVEYLSVKQSSENSSSQNSSADESQGENTQRLLELVKILRKDKELYETKLEVATAESKRLQAKATFVEGELTLARDELAGERSQASIDIQTKAQHAELLRKVEQINVLTDSNRMLRQEKDGMQPKIDHLEEQVSDFQAAKVSLENKVTELTMAMQNVEGERGELQTHVDHWKRRSNSLVEKYDREKAEEIRKQSEESEQHKKAIANYNQQIQKLTAELTRTKTAAALAEGEKTKLTAKVTEYEEKLSTSQTTLTRNKEEIGKKESMINDLKRLGRNYRLKYNKLLEETKAGTSAAADGEEGTSTSSASMPAGSSQPAAGEAVTKLKSEVSAMKESLTSKDEELNKLRSDLEQANVQLAEPRNQLETAKKELADQIEQCTKLGAELLEISTKHTALKDFVNNSLKLKITSQKKELDKKNEEIKQLKSREAELESQLDENQQSLLESKAKLLSLMEEKSTAAQTSGQSGHITASTDSKRSQVRTIEVRPMAQQQPKQLTATVMPTTSQTEPPEVLIEEPMVGIVSPTSMAASPNSNVPSNSVSAEVAPVQQLPSQPSSTCTMVTSTAATLAHPPGADATVFASLHSVTPQAMATSTVAATSQILSSLHSGTQAITTSTSGVATPHILPGQTVPAAIITAQASSESSVLENSAVIGSLATSSTNMGAAGDGVEPGQSSEAEGNRIKRTRDEYEADDENESPSSKRTRETTQEVEEGYIQEVDEGTSQDIDTDEEQFPQDHTDTTEYVTAVSSMQQENITPYMDQGAAGTSGAEAEIEQSFSAEPSREDSLPAFDSDHTAATSGFYETATEHVQLVERVPLTSRPVRQEPTYSGVNADVVVIVSSDEEDAEDVVQPSYQTVGDEYTEEESEEGEEGEDEMGEEEEYEEVEEEGEDASSEEEEGVEEQNEEYESSDSEGVAEGEEAAAAEVVQFDDDDDDDQDNSDIIMIEDDETSNAAGNNMAMSVSSSQPSAADNGSRRLATLAALNYQAQGTVSVDSNVNDGDGIVPSTPTLALPVSRNDGFAVAVSSPNPSVAPFVFGSSAVPSADYADLAQQAIVMEDLAQFGDSEAGTLSASNEVNEVDGTSSAMGEPMATTSSQEQSNVVSTESHFELDSSTSTATAATAATATTSTRSNNSDEPVSSSEANNEGGRANVIEPIVWHDVGQSSQSDMPSSSSQSRPPVARRGRGGRLNRPTFNKPQ